jgi:hypothetical protein
MRSYLSEPDIGYAVARRDLTDGLRPNLFVKLVALKIRVFQTHPSPRGGEVEIKLRSTRVMKYRIDDSAHAVSVQTSHDTSRNFLELLGYILADAESDISVAARDYRISDSSFIRLRRARDRVACAQSVLETMREIAGTTAGVAGTSPTGSKAERDLGTIAAAMRGAVELLARGWLEDYSAGAVKWLVASSIGTPDSVGMS